MHFTKESMRKRTRMLSLALCFAMILTLIPIGEARADTRTIMVTADGGDITLDVGESVQLQVGSTVYYEGRTYDVARYDISTENYYNVLSVTRGGEVTAIRPGSAQVSVEIYVDFDDADDYDAGYGYYGRSYLLFSADYDITVRMDLSDVKVDKTSQTGYTSDSWYLPEYKFYLQSKETLSEDWYSMILSCSSSNPDIEVYASLENNVLTISPSNVGKTTVTVKINDQTVCKVTINTILIQMSTTSALLATKQTKQLRVKGCKNSAVKWSSTNPGVVSVSSKGLIKAKKTGNAVIKAKIGDYMVGCAVSVVTASKKKAINTAIHIAQTSSYSQPKRMQNGYYDCSSLVWKAYHKNGVNFGNAYYAPVAADVAKWCAQKKKMVKGGLSSKNIDSMKINAGDLVFRTGDNNGRYKGIYHVEMIVGYDCVGFDSDGKPMLYLKYAARGEGYADGSGEPVGRP